MEIDMAIPMRRPETPAATAIEDVLIRGDLSKLNEQQRTEYYLRLCNSIGLNPMTQPFQYLTLNGKLVLYARRDCADQLRKINGISIEIVSQDRAGDLLSIHVRAKDKDGRMDEDLGVVFMPETLKGEAAANAILKAVTKAKRRVTLSLSGLGFLDETEVADIPASAKRHQIEHDEAPSDTGELLSAEQVEEMRQLIVDRGANLPAFLKWAKVENIEDIRADYYESCMDAIRRAGK
jgi:hypothetical protein